MAKGFDANQERKQALSFFGKDLARRAKSKCELTQKSGVSLVTYEIPPVPNEPEFDRCLLVSEDVLRQLEKPSTLRAGEWRHLSEVIWSQQSHLVSAKSSGLSEVTWSQRSLLVSARSSGLSEVLCSEKRTALLRSVSLGLGCWW